MKTRKRPLSARILTQWVDAYAREHDQPPARVRNWISHMVLGGALERAGFDGAGRTFSIKGGVALEMRLRNRARATRDLDLILLSGGDPIQELSSALASPYEGFSFRLRGPGHVLPNGAARVEVALDYLGKSWGTVQVDVGPQEGGGTEVDMVEAISLAPFGLGGPGSLPCLSLPHHVAQKIHAMTAPQPEGRRNDRFRDLADLLLMREWITDFQAVRQACEDVFQARGTHAWPPPFRAPEHWAGPFAALAQELGLEPGDVHQAAHEVRAFINRIDQTSELVRPVGIDDSVTAVTWFFVVGKDETVQRIPAERGEALYMGDLPPDAADVPLEWQREPGGVAMIGVLMLLQNRRPVFVQRTATRGRALSPEIDGKPVEFTPAIWNVLAVEVLRGAKAPERAVGALASFLSHAAGPLPADVAGRAGTTIRDLHRYFVPPMMPDGVPLWDLTSSELVRYEKRRTPSARAA